MQQSSLFSQLSVGLLSMATLAAVGSALSGAFIPSEAKDVTGKVVGVFHEKVTVNNQALDKVSVTVMDCATGGQFYTAAYPAATVSDENYYGHLYDHLLQSAMSTSNKNQFMNTVTGHVTLTVDDATGKTISKTKFWGYNWECGRNVGEGAGSASAAPSMGGSMGGGGMAAPAAPPQAAPASGGGFGKVRRFGGF